MRRSVAFLALAAALAGLVGCANVERTITVRSEPAGALVWLNDQEVGRTPVTRNFKWYGTYDVEVRKEGYQTLKTKSYVGAPWWQWVPFDLVADLAPGRREDHHDLSYTLAPTSDAPVDPQALVGRGEQLRTRLESGERTRLPDTAPTAPKKRHPTTTSHPAPPDTQPTTEPSP